MKIFQFVFFAVLTAIIMFDSSMLLAAEPIDWQLNMQEAATPVKERVHEFHNIMLVIITSISLFVLALLIYVVLRYNKKANPEPATFTHNYTIEAIWIAIPCMILLVIGYFSLPMLHYMDKAEDPEMSIKVIGYQWYWGYEYPDHGDISFNSYMIPDDEIDYDAGQKRLLSTDQPAVVPVDTTVQMLVTAADVIHSAAMPSWGVKMDAIPGRLNETWFRVTEPGTYYGQCSEICGKGHAYMPLEFVVVPKEEFEAWTKFALEEDTSYYEFKKQYTK